VVERFARSRIFPTAELNEGPRTSRAFRFLEMQREQSLKLS
jgi:hypothetical protein